MYSFLVLWGFFLGGRSFFYRVHVLTRRTERDREIESEKSPPREDGHAAIPSPPFSSRDPGHARTHARREIYATGSETRTAVDYVGVQRHSHYANCWFPLFLAFLQSEIKLFICLFKEPILILLIISSLGDQQLA